MVEEVLSQEDREVEALVSLMDSDNTTQRGREELLFEYGESDDEEYERLFVDAVAAAEKRNTEANGSPSSPPHLDQDMDTTLG